MIPKGNACSRLVEVRIAIVYDLAWWHAISWTGRIPAAAGLALVAETGPSTEDVAGAANTVILVRHFL